MADKMIVPNDTIDTASEDAYNLEMAAKAEGAEIQTQDAPPLAQDKFGGDYDKLMQSYKELERKQSIPEAQPTTGDLEIDQAPEVADVPFDMEGMQNYYMEHGQLDDSHYQTLEKNGISKMYADRFIEGQKAIGKQIGDSVKISVGGDAENNNMNEWAGANYTQDQIMAYNKAVNSGDINTAIMAAKGLRADYVNSAGNEGITYSGTQAAPEGEGDVFRSNAEVTTAMKDPKYEHDHAYRQDVQDKLERSNVFKGGVV